MKKAIIFLFIVLPFISFSQTDTTKIEQYCEMTAQGKLFSNKITIDIDFGEGKSLFSFKDTRLKDEFTGKVRSFKSTVDALNYFGGLGWKLLNAFPVSEQSGLGGLSTVYHFFFVKSFDKNLFVKNE